MSEAAAVMLDRSPEGEEKSLAGQRLWNLSQCVADVAGYQGSEHDPEGASEMLAKGDTVDQAHFIGELFGLSA